MMKHIQNFDSSRLSTIRLTDSYKIKYWSKKFNLSEHELAKVIMKVGDNVEDVEKYLKGMRN